MHPQDIEIKTVGLIKEYLSLNPTVRLSAREFHDVKLNFRGHVERLIMRNAMQPDEITVETSEVVAFVERTKRSRDFLPVGRPRGMRLD